MQKPKTTKWLPGRSFFMCDEADSKSMNKEAGNWNENRNKTLNKAKPIESINMDNLSFPDK